MYYILQDGKPVATNDMKALGESFQKGNRRVAKDKIGDSEVSTVFLAIDHQHGEGAPVLFETMVFGGELDEEMDRYSTLEQAQEGHKAMVKRVKDAQPYDYKFNLAALAQNEILTMKDLEGILDAAEGLCDEIIRSQTKPDDIDYTASQLITVISQFKAWNDLDDLPAE